MRTARNRGNGNGDLTRHIEGYLAVSIGSNSVTGRTALVREGVLDILANVGTGNGCNEGEKLSGRGEGINLREAIGISGSLYEHLGKLYRFRRNDNGYVDDSGGLGTANSSRNLCLTVTECRDGAGISVGSNSEHVSARNYLIVDLKIGNRLEVVVEYLNRDSGSEVTVLVKDNLILLEADDVLCVVDLSLSGKNGKGRAGQLQEGSVHRRRRAADVLLCGGYFQAFRRGGY